MSKPIHLSISPPVTRSDRVPAHLRGAGRNLAARSSPPPYARRRSRQARRRFSDRRAIVPRSQGYIVVYADEAADRRGTAINQQDRVRDFLLAPPPLLPPVCSSYRRGHLASLSGDCQWA